MSQLAARKGVVSRFCKSIRDYIADNAQFTQPYDFPAEPKDLRSFLLRKKMEVINAQIKFNVLVTSLENAVEKFCITVDQLELGPEHDAATKTIVDGAQDALMEASDFTAEFKCRIQSLADQQADLDQQSKPPANVQQPQDAQQPQPAQPQQVVVTVEHPDNYLPRTPIPNFYGQITEWDNFWELFNDNVHQRTISNLQKFNYLLDALKGDAKACIGRFQVTSDNYDRAIALLKKKYGDKEVLAMHLHRRLEAMKARSTSTKDQRLLLDELVVVSEQLIQSGETMDGTWMLNKLLSKFEERLQRAVLKKKGRMQAGEVWDHERLTEFLEEAISDEERIETVLNCDERRPETGRKEGRSSMKPSSTFHSSRPFQRRPCIYCQSSDHGSSQCTVKQSPKERMHFLQSHNLCGNCGSARHAYKDCRAGGCLNCGGKHHRSTCFKDDRSSTLKGTSPAKVNTYSKPGVKEATHSTQQQKNGPNYAKDKKPTARQNFAAEQVPEDEDSTEMSYVEDNILHMHKEPSRKGNVIILTGTVKVIDPDTKKLQKVQILLDTGSELSFIATSLAEKLRLPTVTEQTLNLHTFGSPVSKEKICSVTTLDIMDAHGDKHTLQLLKNDYITSKLSPANLTKKDWRFIKKKHITLSMSRTESQTTIQPQILLGCDQMWNLMNSKDQQLELPSGLQLIPSKLGYIITGQQRSNMHSSTCVNMLHNSTEPAQTRTRNSFCVNMVHTSTTDEEKELWDRYWTLDSTGVNEYVGPEHIEKNAVNQEVLDNFNQTIEKREDGYYVRLPWKEDNIQLPDNRAIALKRLQGFLRNYKDRHEILLQYDGIFKDQLNKGILEEVDEAQPAQGTHIHYIPHQPVITPLKETTKLRVVFDASAHFKGCPSLNEALHQGPVILPELIGMLLRFRIGKYAIISDVEKAFLQVRLQEIDRDATRCLWVRDLDQPVSPSNIVVYRFTRVTFGINSSPFLLAATINHHLDHYEDNQEIVKEIQANLYVDNLLLSAQDIDEAKEKCTSVKKIFDKLNMNLREFLANEKDITAHMEEKDRSSNTSPKVLGVKWNSRTDMMELEGNMPERDRVTKRTVTQQIASLYDPHGWMVPLVLPAKLYLQNMWRHEIAWDVAVSEDMETEWRRIQDDIRKFHKEIPRSIGNKRDLHTLITFTDASEAAMAACTYLVNSTCTSSHLLIAKSKLPSVKDKPTIPKMEMNGVTMGARLSQHALEELRGTVRIEKIIIMSDSTITLSWIRAPPDRKTTGILVNNRIKEIRRIVKDMEKNNVATFFGYVNTHQNPADHGTRGLSSSQFMDHYWWSGPAFITAPEERWPADANLFQLTEDTEGEIHVPAEVNVATEARIDNQLFDLSRFGNLQKAQRVGVYMLRFLKKLSKSLTAERRTHLEKTICEITMVNDNGHIRVAEMNAAHDVIVRDHQTAHVTPRLLHSAQALNVKKDNRRLYRCYGRLGSSQLSDNAKTPYFIAPKTDLARLIINNSHSQLHIGIAHTMSDIRQKYWIPQLRQQVRSLIIKCVPCQRFNNLPFKYPEMDALPSKRVVESHPFENIGLDYFGPLSITSDTAEPGKAYGCILTCMTTRLLHLELVKDVSTTSFLNAMRRFFARRGVPRSITSDNAPTFLLGEEILRDAIKEIENNEEVSNSMTSRAIDWKHITPYSPWQGGFYERMIKTVKQALYKSLGKQPVNFEDMMTILAEIEASINTRPLTYQEERWDQQPVLRPIDFIQRDIEIAFPIEHIGTSAQDSDYLPPEEELSLRTRRQAEEALRSSHQKTEKFWKIWQGQYLTSLREKHQRTIDSKKGGAKTPSVGTVVLVMDDNLPRHQWRMGRIDKLVANSKGVIREVELYMPNKRTIRRPVNLIVPLELESTVDCQTVTTYEDSAKDTQERLEQEEDKPTSRYQLRRRKKVDYNEVDDHHVNVITRNWLTHSTWITLITILAIISPSLAQSPITATVNNSTGSITCTPGGAILRTHRVESVEICAEDYCTHQHQPSTEQLIKFPAEILLHDHKVRWKISDGNDMVTMETTCTGSPFCESIDCTFCTAIVFNPECWPVTSILVMGIFIYLVVMGCYIFLYIPLVFGLPLRVVASSSWTCARLVGSAVTRIVRCLLRHMCRSDQRTREERIRLALAIVCTLLIFEADGCQRVDVFTHHSSVCTFANDKHNCKIETSEVMKINPYKREACLKIVGNDTTITELKVRWKGLDLHCEATTDYFTRQTRHNVIDSKRCPHSGSCVNDKCGSINRTTLVPELMKRNKYPGTTGCLESCGGPGCDCFYLSSGCLFYRIYLVPETDEVYEVFRCTRWREQVNLEVSWESPAHPAQSGRYDVTLQPNVPVDIRTLSLTLSSLTVPPTPLLTSTFISDGEKTALWTSDRRPALQCTSVSNAFALRCEVMEDCTCNAAETRINCRCTDVNITSVMNDLEKVFPLSRPAIHFTHPHNGTVIAHVHSMATAEIVMNLHDSVSIVSTQVRDSLCLIDNVHITGCYHCAKGASTTVTCTSDGRNTSAEIDCGTTSFIVPCSKQGVRTQLHFNPERAQVYMQCTTSCGTRKTSFEITGILKFTTTLHTSWRRIVEGESNVYSEVCLPDFGHILDVYLSWYKTLILTFVMIGAALFISYLTVTTCGARLLGFVWKTWRKITCGILRVLWKCTIGIYRKGEERQRQKAAEKLL